MTEITDLQDALRAIAKEIHPCRKHHADRMTFSDETLFLGILLQRQLARKIDVLPPRYAEGTDPHRSARSNRRTEPVE